MNRARDVGCRRAAPFAVALAVLAFGAPPASASHQYLSWDDEGRSYAVFGANQQVTIHDGAIEYECDFIAPTADVYIVPAGVLPGQALEDVSGTPNTIQGAGGGH